LIEFYLEIDGSILGQGAVLAQKNEADLLAPIAFASRSLQKHEKITILLNWKL